jgi:hypothetical protein
MAVVSESALGVATCAVEAVPDRVVTLAASDTARKSRAKRGRALHSRNAMYP